MALINCEECGQRISDKAEYCPHCGCPVNSSNATEEFVQESEFPEEPKRKNKGLLCGIITVVVLLIGAGVWWAFSAYGNEASSKDVKITPEFVAAVHNYDELYSFSEGLAAVKKDGKYGFIDTEGQLVIPCKFFGVGAFSEGLAVVYDDKYNVSFINLKGETVLTTPYQIQYNLYNQGGDNPNYIDNLYLNDVEPVEFIHGICKIPEAGPEGYWEDVYINTKGEKVTEPTKTDGTTETPKEEFSIFEDENTHKFGVKDASGKVVVPAQYSHIDKFSNGVARFYNNIHGDFIDYQDMRRGQYEGEEILTRVYGYIDLKGNSTYTDADSNKAIEWMKNQQAVVNARHLREEAEEETQRQAEEETRRQGQERVIWVEYDMNANGNVIGSSLQGSHSPRLYDNWGDLILSDPVSIPEGKKWILKRIETDSYGSGVTYIRIYRPNGYVKDVIKVLKNDTEQRVFYSPDRIALQIELPSVSNAHHRVTYYFIEKNEND